ncbi:MAG: deoxyribonuclease IV [Phycisphaerae bacterium]
MVRLGAHMSVAGAMSRAVRDAVELGMESLQVFTANQRQWSPKAPDGVAIGDFKKALWNSGITSVVSHASYLINLATAHPVNRRRSLEAMGAELERCAALGIKLCVVHPGAHLGDGEAVGIERIAAALDEVYDARPALKVRTLLETTAGQGTAIGYRFEHLRDILGACECRRRLGVCVDTCHIHAAGYDITTDAGYEATVKGLFRCVGKSRVKCLHLNDSKGGVGSRIDRHTHIGRGTIGVGGFRRVVNDARFAGLPGILETPKGETDGGKLWDAVNIKKLGRLIGRGSNRAAAGRGTTR